MFYYHKILFYTLWCYNEVISIPPSINSTLELINMKNNVYKEENKTVDSVQNIITKVTVNDINNMLNIIPANISRTRVKRQNSGAGKFAEASKMPQLKLLRLFLQMFKNFWDRAYVGGAHPLHPNVPKAIVALYKEKVVEFFIPDVGEDTEKTMAT